MFSINIHNYSLTKYYKIRYKTNILELSVTTKKEYYKVLWSLVFLRTPLMTFSLHAKHVVVQRESFSSWAIGASSYSGRINILTLHSL